MKHVFLSLFPIVVACLSLGCGKVSGTAAAQKEQSAKPTDSSGEKQTAKVQAPLNEGHENPASLSDEGKDDPLKSLLGGINDLLGVAGELGQEILGLSVAERKKVGKLMHERVTKEHDVVSNSKQLVRIKKLAQPFLKKIRDVDLEWKFTVLKSDAVNAFSHVGGYFYFNTGLLNVIESDAELQFIIGHEIGHVVLKQCAQSVAFSLRAKQIGTELGGDLGGELAGQVTAVTYGTLSKAYSEKQEFDADKWSYETLRKAGHSKEVCLAGVRGLLKREKKRGTKKNDSGIDDQITRAIDNHFRTHPPAEQRLARLKKMD